jgi:hypothetical protein
MGVSHQAAHARLAGDKEERRQQGAAMAKVQVILMVFGSLGPAVPEVPFFPQFVLQLLQQTKQISLTYARLNSSVAYKHKNSNSNSLT